MEIEFWEQRWSQNQTAFHLPTVNPCLTQYWPVLNIQAGSQVFIPLCGKSLDLAWFASSQYSVLGIECSEQAINAFFNDQNMQVNKNQQGPFKLYQADNIKVLQGDFFALNSDNLNKVNAVYDRASLVALPEIMRQKYVSLLTEILPLNVEILLITLEYNPSKMTGPPFSVTQNEVLKLFQPAFNVELLGSNDVLEDYQKFKERGLDYLTECIYRIHR